MTSLASPPNGLNWSSGLMRIAVLIYGLWIFGFLTWRGFFLDLFNWMRTFPDNLYVRRAIEARMVADLQIAILAPVVIAMVCGTIFFAVLFAVWWVLKGFTAKGPRP